MTTFKTIEQCGVELVAFTSQGISHDYGVSLEGMDLFPATAARVSFGKDRGKTNGAADIKLINYLADHEHLTPFEYQHATLMIECPLFIRSQIHRHRTFSFNEISRRYTSETIEFWTPTTWRTQATDNRQSSEGSIQHVIHCDDVYRAQCEKALGDYEELLSNGVAREQARSVLPQSLLTRFYMGGNLRNWVHFLKLRQDAHAQYEVQIIANKVHEILHELWPQSLEALMK